jgi:hypothetical protein
MPDLSTGQQVGGVYVVIAATTDKLRAGVAEAKVIAQQAERSIRISLPVIADTTQLKAELPRIVAAANVAARTLPIRIPVMLDVSGVAAQMALVRGMLGGGGGGGGIPWGGGPVGVNIPSGGGQLMLPGPGGVPATITGGGSTQYATVSRVGGGGGGGYVNIPGAVGGAAAGAAVAKASPDYLKQIIKGVAVLRTAEFLAGSATNTISLHEARNRGDLSGELAAQQQQEQLAVSAGNVFLGAGSAGLAIRDLASWHGGRNDRAYINEITFATEEQEKKNARLAVRASAGRAALENTGRISLSNSLAFATSGEAGVAQANYALSEFDRTTNGNEPGFAAQRAALQQSVAIAGKQRGIEQQVFNGNIQAATQGAGLQVAGIRAYYAGDTEAAAKAERDAQRVGLVAQQRAAVLKAPDSEKQGLRTANKADLQLFDEQSAKEAYDRQKQRAADLTQTIGAKQAAGLAISKQYFAAELAAFDAKTKAEISLIDDKTAKQNAADRAAAQRSVMVAQEQQRVGQAVRLSEAGAAGAGLRIAHRGDQAALVEFDARARETLANIADPQERRARERELAAQRAELVNSQREDRTNRQAALSTRTAQAQAFDRYGVYQPGVAGVIGQIAGYKAELRNAPATDVVQIQSTQAAELKSLQKRIIGENAGQYALAFDPRYDAARPNGGADEQLKELKLISGYLRQLASGGSGSTLATP